MSPEGLASIVRAILCAWLGLLILIVVFGVLFGTINTTGLLNDKQGGPWTANRLALLLTTFGFAFYYTIEALRSDPPAFPDVSTDMLVALLGANGFYLTNKIALTGTGSS
jgi:hypothetical protein